jgi:2-oxoglutarate dehydrogenase E2 component (dihydrolipoamide succinyltransferase)
MAIEIKVPLLPESISDATVSTWHKKEGDKVSRDENIVDLETDKVMLEVPSPVDGIIKKIVKATGSTVHAEEVLAMIEEISENTEDSKPKKSEKSEKKTEENKQSENQSSSASSKESMAGPAARRAAAEYDVNVLQITGTGKGGRITKENVMAATVNQPTVPSTAPMISVPMGERPEKRVPMTRIRTRIAERLLEVKQNTAMLTTFNEVNM